jgi:hypothetical protein
MTLAYQQLIGLSAYDEPAWRNGLAGDDVDGAHEPKAAAH